MGRSKFPGKPTKHVNRTRINVLSTVVNTTVVCDSNPTVVTVEEGDNSKKVKLKTSKRKESIEQTSSSQRVRLCKRKSQTGITNKRSSLRRSLLLNTSTTKLTRSKVARRSVRGYGNLRKLSKNKLSTSPKKESSNLVGKFVLPSRSVHSSRVIKPNKRFINIEQNETRLVKKRVVAKRQCTAVVNDEESTKTDDAPSTSTGKVVLRQARLQIGTSISAGADGPFSSNHNKASIVGPAGTVTCGVCGAVRFCRFVKQARKFNIYSCESCRRFISKLIQRVSCNKASTITLNCHKGQGTCHVPPTVHNQQWKFNRITYNSRCPACWLKQCLRSFHIPMTLKTGLTQFLPKHMQTNDTLFASSLPLLSWPSSSENQSPKTSPETNDINLRQRPVRLKLVKKDEKTNPPPVVNDIKRQKIDLKGPRVKHVCRSASIVLGQPIAVFPRAVDPQEKKPIENTNSAVLKPKNIDAAPSDKNDKTAEKEEIAATMKITRDSVQPAAPTRREKAKTTSVSSMHPIEITKPSITKKSKKISPQIENTNVISIDYWENYDPDEIIRNGFSIIASEAFPMQAICYLCGSAGKESLLYCCICCEPYHPFCLEQGPPNIVGPEQKYTWICPKCTTCSACGEADRQKINCQKCHKAYHPQCFNTKWRTDDRPTVCSNCLRCKSCGTDNITKFVGNVALCLLCFKLRNKGNFCPICQCCYDDNDFDTKMMECGKCNKWVHAKCESLSDEQYQILSILPESVEFLCCLCSNQPTPYWKKAVQLELRSCFNNILRLLSKNRVARDMLKLSPFKPSGQTVKQLSSARRLQFVDNESNLNADIENSIDSDLEQVNAIFKNKINFGDSYNSSTSGESKTPISPSMVEIKNKLNCNEYFSLSDFNEGMEHALKSTSSNELLNIYHNILKKVFPWFDPNVKKTLNKYICDTFRAERNEETEKKFSFEIFDVHAPDKIDHRVCNFCKGIGDGLPDKEARLLYCGQNDWVHANCALWSSEVYEEIDGSLQNVQSAVTRGRSIRCALCKQKGATVGCCRKGCYETYHFPCAQKAKCHFIVDKTMYCSSHEIGDKLIVLSTPREFEIRRPVYIEVDTRKKKLCEPEKINFMIGSLTVINLGKVIPSISDHVDALIPVGFVCSRLFWSTTEPWKLIPYKITLSVLNSNSSVYVDKNFTVDHTLPKQAVEKKLREICSWRDDKEKCDAGEYEDCEEPQNTGDILSPELTDAILEELPHDLLDGISVQDVLMGYEELMNIDFKNTEINCTDLNTEGDSADDKKRSKSDVYQRIEDKIKPRQKSCSLTWLQLDNTLSPAMKKRKIAPTRDNMFMQLLQVDGACDSSGSECGSPTRESEIVWSNDVTEEPVTCEKCQCTYRTDASYKRHLESCEAMFTSESETENETLVINVNETPESQLVTSYESFNSFQAGPSQVQSTVMNSQTVLSETNKFQESSVIYNYQPIKPVVPVHSNVININQTVAENQFCVSQQNVCVNQNVALNQPNLISLEKNSIALNSPIISVDNAHVNNQINPINGVIDIQQQPVTLQSVPYTQEMQPIINIAPQNQAITIDAKMLAPMVNLPQNQWVRPILNKPKPRPRIVAKRPRLSGNTIVLPQNSASVILQHIPSTNILPFVDTFQPVGQNMHYVATIAPQLNSAITPQPQLVQLQDNFINIVPNVQPTMIIQQPRVDTGQLIVDGNGSMMWAPQPIQQIQPVYYGFETIVQNTVMQSQQFLPTTVPGVLTTNSSYSATTQVFQTSKLEPVMDGSFVLVNSNPHVQMPQVQTNIAPQPQPIAANVQIQAKPTTWSNIAVQPTPPQPPQPVPAPQVSQPALQHVQSMPVHSLPPQPIPPQPPKTVPPPTVHAIQPKPIQPLQTQSIQPLQTQSIQPLQPQSIQPLQPQSIQPLQQPQPIQSLQIVEVPQPKQLIKPVESSQPVQSSQPVKPSQPIQTLQPAQSPTSPPHEPLPPLPVPETPPKIEETKSPPPVSPVTIEIQTSHIQIKPLPSTTASTAPTTNSITLPVAPFVPEQGIPTNIVTPTVKPPATQFRPMNRVLPMQTTQTQLKKPDKLVINKETANNNEIAKNSSPDKKPKIKILGDIVVKQSTPLIDASNIKSEPIKDPEVVREETKEVKPEIISPIKESKVERDCPELIPKIHIAPLKPIKTKLSPSQIADKENNIDKLRQPEVDDTSKLLKYNKRTSHSTSIFYKIESPDGIDYTATSLPQIWRKVFTEVQAARLAHNLPPLPEIALRTINDLDVLGLRAKGMRYLLEQLPEVAKCKAYKSVFHKHKSIEKVDDDDDEESSRRCLPFERRHEKYDMFGWLSSKHRTLEMYDLDAVLKKNASSSLPMAMRFRALRVISKYSVGVYRSDIHGRGLFSLRDIESGEMVIEYAGEVIRSLLTDKREKYYNSKGIGCYMFRIDDNLVVDATMKGNAARFINHSCDPNCYSKVVEILGCKHIIIFALRKIICGEELTYDYKFPFEEDKIPCTCGTKRCRKFLN